MCINLHPYTAEGGAPVAWVAAPEIAPGKAVQVEHIRLTLG